MSASAQILNPIPAHEYTLDQIKRNSYAEVCQESAGLGARIIFKTAASDWLKAMQVAASQRFDFVVLGSDAIRSDSVAALNFGTIALEPASLAQKEVRKVFQDCYVLKGKPLKNLLNVHFREGAIVNAANWYVFLNDCFMYGAIGAGKEFHVGLESIDNQLLWDEKNMRPRVLGRELLMLKLAGYIPFVTEHGYTFAPPCLRDGELTPIETFRAEINKVKSIKPILEFINQAVPLNFQQLLEVEEVGNPSA